MEYVYAALLLHKAGKKVDEASVKKVLDAAGVKVDDAKVKVLVAALEGVDIEEAIKQAPQAPVASQPIVTPESGGGEKKKEEEKPKDEGSAAEGLGALFG